MAIDRTFLNAWVDDDGSGLSGTVWNKARINEMLNAIDAQLAGWQSWSPQWLTSPNSEVFVPAQNSCRFYKTGNVCHVNIYAEGCFFAGAADALQFFMPSGCVIATPTIERFAVLVSMASGGTWELGYGTAKDAYIGEIRRANHQQFPPFSQVGVHGQGFYLL